MKNTIAKALLAPLFAVGLLTAAPADAAVVSTVCTVTRVQYDVGRLALWCSGDSRIYYAASFSLGTNCSVQNAETLKTWTSMAQAAMLSARPLTFYWQDSCVVPSIHDRLSF